MPNPPLRPGRAGLCPRGLLTTLVLLSSLVLATGPVHAQIEIPEWTTTIDGLTSDADQAFDVAIDSNGDVLAAGVIF